MSIEALNMHIDKISLLEYACLSSDVYNVKEEYNKEGYYIPQVEFIKDSWIGLPGITNVGDRKIIDDLYRRDNFFARLYANIHTLKTVIAYRGTQLNYPGTLKADYDLTFNLSSEQDRDALLFYSWAKTYLGSNFALLKFSTFPDITGHSLGGYLAQYVALLNSCKAITFNAPGIGRYTDPIFGRLDKLSKQAVSRIYNFNVDYDQIHKVGEQIGNIYTMHGDNWCGEAIGQVKDLYGANIDTAGIAAYCVIHEHSIDRMVELIHAGIPLHQQV